MKEKFTVDWNDILKEALEKPSLIAEVSKHFKSYSNRNKMLIFWQCQKRKVPLQQVATYQSWQTVGRQVKKGSKALALCVPCTIKKKDAQGKETGAMIPLFYYKYKWFLLQDTEGESQAPKQTGNIEFDQSLALYHLGIQLVQFDETESDCYGYARKKDIAINPNAADFQATLFHEMGHIVLGHTDKGNMIDGAKLDKSSKEVEAEATAYICLAMLGSDKLDESRDYLQDYLKDQTLSDKSAERIFNAADKILSAGNPKREEREALSA